MAQQIINIGSGENEGDGGNTRLAFEKINSNFDELYAGTVQTLSLVGTTLSISGGNQVTLDNVFDGGVTGNVTGSVFGDDSSLLVDGVNNLVTGDIQNASTITEVLKILPRSNAPTDPQDGEIYRADGTGWDPRPGGAITPYIVMWVASLNDWRRIDLV